MGIINTEPKAAAVRQTTNQERLDAFVTFRLSSQELHELKLKAKKEKRTISNYIKTQLF